MEVSEVGLADEWSFVADGAEGGFAYMDAGDGVRVFDMRRQWSSAFSDSGPVEKIGYAVHHSVTGVGDGSLAGDLAVIEAIHRYHVDVNGWGGIGYHRVIGSGRRVYLVGGSAGQRAHVAGLNHQYIGWCLLGDWSHVRPDDDRMTALRVGLSWETDRRGVPMVIAPHKRLNEGTLCPGGWAARESWAGLVLRPGVAEPSAPAPGAVVPPSARQVFEEMLRRARAALADLEDTDDELGIPG